MHGKTVLVTGATDGLGRALAGALAGAGATVLVHGRDPARGQDTLGEIRAATPGADLHFVAADLASLAELRALVAEIRTRHPRLHALVNNAGIGTSLPGGGERMTSADGHELRFAVNYLAGFLLTRELLPALTAGAPARIVNVASAGQAPIDFEDVMLERRYSGVQAYCQSKLAQVMFTIDLAAELEGTGVSATCLHPGTFMPTKIVLDAGVQPITSLEDGVRATLRLVADSALEGVSGRYFDGLHESAPHPQALDPAARRRLRELSERLVG
jgi:NAD(P)-dependent dehydrogenase (short-subunit alcohol dehydrogenase family)